VRKSGANFESSKGFVETFGAAGGVGINTPGTNEIGVRRHGKRGDEFL